MKWATASLAVFLGAGWAGASLQAVMTGFGIGHEVSGWCVRSGWAVRLLSTGLITERVAGQRAPLLDIAQRFLQACCLPRRVGTGWNAGPAFEGGLRVEL